VATTAEPSSGTKELEGEVRDLKEGDILKAVSIFFAWESPATAGLRIDRPDAAPTSPSRRFARFYGISSEEVTAARLATAPCLGGS
jgi:hypothetical protein